MNTGKDYGLPEEYHDWVRVDDGWIPTGRRVRLDWAEFGADGICDARSGDIYFVPPKPKPTLPDVGPGGVLAYTDKRGRKCRAMQFEAGKWRVYTYVGEIVVGPPPGYWHDTDLFAHANDGGFTVELEGL